MQANVTETQLITLLGYVQNLQWDNIQLGGKLYFNPTTNWISLLLSEAKVKPRLGCKLQKYPMSASGV